MQCACGKTISGNKVACRDCMDKETAKVASAPAPTGCLEILNVQAGDMKITFDTGNIAETIRAKRIITDMLRRGYALVVEVERDGKRAYERAQGFDEKTGEYIIADFAPVEPVDDRRMGPQAETPDQRHERTAAVDNLVESATEALAGKGRTQDPNDATKCSCGAKWKHQGTCKGVKRSYRRLPMETTKATGIGRSAGG
jgi:hypothetical protein